MAASDLSGGREMQVRSEQNVAELAEGPLTVRKDALDLGREGVIGIRLTARSRADRPLYIELTEEFPGHVSMSDVQVHPGYQPDRWAISEPLRQMVYSNEVSPGGEVETVYGVRVADGNLEPFLSEPRVELGSSSEQEPGEGVINRDTEPRPAGGQAEISGGPAPESADVTAGGDPTHRGSQPHSPDAEPADSLQELFQFGEDRPAAATEHDTPRRTAAPADNQAEANPQERIESLIASLASVDLSEAQRHRIAEVLGLDPAGRDASVQLDDSLDRLAQLVAELERLVDAAQVPAPRQPRDGAAGSTTPDAAADGAEAVDGSTGRRLSLLDREAGDRRESASPNGEDTGTDGEPAERPGRFTTDHEETIRSFSADSDGG